MKKSLSVIISILLSQIALTAEADFSKEELDVEAREFVSADSKKYWLIYINDVLRNNEKIVSVSTTIKDNADVFLFAAAISPQNVNDGEKDKNIYIINISENVITNSNISILYQDNASNLVRETVSIVNITKVKTK